MTARPQDVELLPCPFCGSPAEIDKGGFGEVFAACSKCWCHMGGAWSVTESAAAEAWNRRACVEAEVASLAQFLRIETKRANAQYDRAERLAEALRELFADYKCLADSGDAGFWKLEETEVGKKAMAALATNAAQPGETM